MNFLFVWLDSAYSVIELSQSACADVVLSTRYHVGELLTNVQSMNVPVVVHDDSGKKIGKQMLIAILFLNIILWLALAITTGHEYELFFPTIALIPGAVLSGFLLKYHSYWSCVCLTIGSALIADLVWIVYEISFVNKMSHNLAPFELIATGLFATLVGLCGVGPGKLYQRFAKRE